MRILSHHNLNLHSKSTTDPNGLIHIEKGQTKIVPNDVANHPSFKILLKAGYIVKLKDPKPAKSISQPEPEPEIEEEEPETEDEEEEDEIEEEDESEEDESEEDEEK